ncbi:MAG: TlpA disulfide reductase family protein [bacterium]
MNRFLIGLLLFVSVGALVQARENLTRAKDFKGLTVTGDKINLSDYKGQVVILDFWASWCKPCQKEFPFLIELYNTYYKKGLTVITVNLDENPVNMKKFLSKLKAKVLFPLIVDKEGKIPAMYKVEAMPTTLFIDKRGMIRSRHTGFKDSHKPIYHKELQLLLAEK